MYTYLKKIIIAVLFFTRLTVWTSHHVIVHSNTMIAHVFKKYCYFRINIFAPGTRKQVRCSNKYNSRVQTKAGFIEHIKSPN